MPDLRTMYFPSERTPLEKTRMLDLLEQHIQRNSGNRVERTLRAPLLLPTSKVLEKFCQVTSSTTSLQARWAQQLSTDFCGH